MCSTPEEVIHCFMLDPKKKGHKQTVIAYLGCYPSKGDAIREVGNILMKKWGHLRKEWKDELSRCIFVTRGDALMDTLNNPIGFPEHKT